MEIAILIVFITGYVMITLEQTLNINKAASALLTGVLCWTLYSFSPAEPVQIIEQLYSHLGDIAGILFFLMGAMTIVELIDAHDGFEVITRMISTTGKVKLIWVICFLSFILSAVLDNLATAIVMVSLLRKLIPDRNERIMFSGMVVIAANAGGAWSPIGDVTTSMLWIGGQVTTVDIISSLFLPSLVCLLVPLALVSFKLKGSISVNADISENNKHSVTPLQQKIVLFSGIALLFFVPVFKTITHLPPFMGILLGLALLWIISEIIHKDRDEHEKKAYSVLHALRKIDMPSIFFFLGILIAIAALQSTGQLSHLASLMDEKVGNVNVFVLSIGLLSAIVDNVPLVAAAIGMYDLQVYPTDHYFWKLLAYAAGTGGSILLIGSAAGVAVMGMERMSFSWYLRRVSLIALLGYFSGAISYLLQYHFFGD